MNIIKTCTKSQIFSRALTASEKCNLLTLPCGKSQTLINFFHPYFCLFSQNPLPTWFSIILLTTTLFIFITNLVEEFLAPGKLFLTKYFKLSPALAGVTLLAFASGFDDIIIAFVARKEVGMSFGSLYGGVLFVLTVVVGFSILNSTGRVTVGFTFFRDLGFLGVATAVFCVFGAYGRIGVLESAFLIFLYGVLVFVAVLQDFRRKRREREERERLEEEDGLLGDNYRRYGFNMNLIRKKLLNYMYLIRKKTVIRKNIKINIYKIFQNIFEIIDIPFYLIRKLTIPPSNEYTYNSSNLIITPFFTTLFILLNFFQTPKLWWCFTIPIPLTVSIIFYNLKKNSKKAQSKNKLIQKDSKTTQNEQPPSNPIKTVPNSKKTPKYFIIIVILSLIISIIWTKIISTILIDLLKFVSITTGISNTYLGLTIISIGNVLADGLTIIEIAKKGNIYMCLTGAIAGQILSVLVGFGISMLVRNLESGREVEFFVFDDGFRNLKVVCIAFCFFVMGFCVSFISFSIFVLTICLFS